MKQVPMSSKVIKRNIAHGENKNWKNMYIN